VNPPDDNQTPLEEQIPPAVVGTPSDLPARPDEEITWWRPSWSDVAGHMGYRWLFLLPAVALTGVVVAAVFLAGIRDVLFVLGFKLLLVVVAIVASLAGYVVRSAVRARKEPFCIHCGYNLTGLPDNYRCPECGRPYTWRTIEEYRRDPQWFIERYKLNKRLPSAPAPFAAGPGPRRQSRDGT
jgi:hypothetical protein